MMRPPLEVNNAGDALARLQFMLEASGVLSKDFRNDILGWAYKSVELAHKDGRAEGLRAPRIGARGREYGVRTTGGHITPHISRHVAQRHVDQRQAEGERNVWLVERDVDDWRRSVTEPQR